MASNTLDHVSHDISQPATRRRALRLASALGLGSLLLDRADGAAKKGRKGGKGKKKKRCRGGLGKLAGRCVRFCGVDGQSDPSLCSQGNCFPTYANQFEDQPHVCAIPQEDLLDCEALAERFCNNHGECAKSEVCVYTAACFVTHCTPIDTAKPS